MSTVLMENGVLMYLKGLFYLWWRDERRFKVSTSPSLHSTPTNIEKLEKQETQDIKGKTFLETLDQLQVAIQHVNFCTVA